ncbi:uncharacterized protein LOC114331183 [Diabrotica virgifera virgifera]|uniref:Uncharacterized protein n=1 Tax=Diabrotica virgifera virgifera TaxID=50390 RepID=A0ABM5IMH9_DIAVI|nr:uncharacterized protein LOC114331183 [Diabrotica virgifera virgifera]
MKLLIIFVAICIGGIQLGEAKLCCPKPKTEIIITDANVAAFIGCLKNLVEAHNKPKKFHQQIVEQAHTVANKLTVTVKATGTRSLINDLKKFLRTIYNSLAPLIALVLPRGKDLFDVAAEAAQKVVRWFVHNNAPLVDLLDKIVLAFSSVARVTIESILEIIIGPL